MALIILFTFFQFICFLSQMLILSRPLSVLVKSFTFWQEGGDVNFFELGLSFCIFQFFFFNTFLTDDISASSVTSHCNTFAA